MTTKFQKVDINGKIGVITKLSNLWVISIEDTMAELIKTNKIFTDINEPVYFTKISRNFYWFVKNNDQFKPLCLTDKSIFL